MDAKQFLAFWKEQYNKKAIASGVTYDGNTANIAQSKSSNANLASQVQAQVATAEYNKMQQDFIASESGTTVASLPVAKTPIVGVPTTTKNIINQTQKDIAMVSNIENSKIREKENIRQQVQQSILQTAANTANAGGNTVINNSSVVSGGSSGGGSTSGDAGMLASYGFMTGRMI
jgi:hypothetical protein